MKELATLAMTNMASNPRSLFVMFGLLLSVLLYNKTRQLSYKNKLIARFHPCAVGRFFMYYLVLIRPLERAWVTDVFGERMKDAYEHLIFVRCAEPMDTPHFSKALYNSSLQHLSVGLNVHDYRQVIKSVLRILFSIDYDEEEEDSINVTDAAFGHSSDTGWSIYGISYGDLTNITSDLLRLHHKYCVRVHRWLEGGDAPPSVEPLSMTSMTNMFNNMSSLVQGALEHHPSPQSLQSMVKGTLKEVFQQQMEDVFLPRLRSAVVSETSDALFSMPWPYLIGADASLPDECYSPVVVTPSTLSALRKLLGPKATPKSPEQAKLLQLVLDRRYDVLGILPTGGGKSLLFQVPAYVESGITVCIFPFRALTCDQIYEAQNMGLSVATWPEISRGCEESYHQHIKIDPDETRLVCVSAHWAGTDEFFPWLYSLIRVGILKRIILDEIHQWLLSEYRPCMERISDIKATGVPIVCLTATLTPPAVPSLMKYFGFTSSNFRVVRADTPRPCISYQKRMVKDEDLHETVRQQMYECSLGKDERGLIFCNTYNDCNRLSEMTNIPTYHGEMAPHERDANLSRWRAGETQWLICTSAFGNGINHPHVRYVLHTHSPKTMDRYDQETGRLGRDDEYSQAIMFYTHRDLIKPTNVEPPDAAGRLAMYELLSRPDQCMRLPVSKWADGVQRGHTCSTLPKGVPCGWCLVSRIHPCVYLNNNRSLRTKALALPCNVPRSLSRLNR
jgi:hypothetical protein